MNSQASFLHRGFTLVEMAIVLAVIGVLAVGLFRIISGSNQQLQNQAAANQQLQLINATKTYLASTAGQNYLKENPFCSGLPDGATGNKLCQPTDIINITIGSMSSYLPNGFTSATTNSYGQTYTINALRDSTPNTALPGTYPATYSFMILANAAGVVIPDNSGGAISSQIGADGGFVYSSNVCDTQAGTTDPSQTACGSFSNWAVNLAAAGSYGFTGHYSGSIASRTYVAPAQDTTVPWLARNSSLGVSFNTMDIHTPLYVPSALNMSDPAASTLGTLNFAGGNLTGTANITTAGSTITSFNDGSPTLTLKYNTGTYSTSTLTNPILQITANCTSVPGFVNSHSDCQEKALQLNGDLYMTGQIYGPALFTMNLLPSDVRLKTDIHPLNDSLNKLMALNAVSFIYKQNGQKSLGVIAQDVEKVYPELVNERDGYKYVYYNGLIGPLLGAVQELKHENDALRDEVDNLKKQITLKRAR